MKTHTKALLAGITLFAVAGEASADIIASDDFSTLDPAWVLDVNSDSAGGDLVFESDGTDVVVHEAASAAGDPNEGTMTRTFDATGFTDVTLTLDVRQGLGGTFEGSEYFDLSVDTGSGFVSLFSQTALLSGSAGDKASAADDITIGAPALGVAADNNSSIVVKLTFGTGYWVGSGGTNEEYFAENLVLEGTSAPIPEPSSLALLGLGGLCILRRRRG